jgi:hypothetical protein
LVEERNASEGVAEGREQAKGGDGAIGIRGGEADEGAAAGVEVVGGAERDREKGVGRADDFKGSICNSIISLTPRVADIKLLTRR